MGEVLGGGEAVELENSSTITSLPGSLTSNVRPVVSLKINNKEVSQITSLVLKEAYVELSSDGISRFRASLLNEINTLTDDITFIEGAKVELSVSSGGRLASPMGTYYVTHPTIQKFQDESVSFILDCNGEGTRLLYGGEKRRVFLSSRNSDLAALFAFEYGFDSDIETTNVFYTQVVQANETDWAFLKKRAMMSGKELRVFNNKLIFKQPSFDDSEVVLALGVIPSSNILKASVTVKTIGYGHTIKRSVLDPYSKKISTSSSTMEDDSVTKLYKKEFSVALRSFDEIISSVTSDVTSIKFLTNDGNSQSPQEAADLVLSSTIYDRNLIELDVETDGDERVVPGKTVRVEGLGRFSGPYYVSKVEHYLLPTFRSEIKLFRTFTEDYKPSKFLINFEGGSDLDITTKLPVNGEVSVG